MKTVPRLEDHLCFALYAASRAMTGAYHELLSELGITYPQYLVLVTLWEHDGERVSRIGERLFLDSATLTPLLKRLEGRGLVERRRSRADERVVEVFLTRDGKRLRSDERITQLAGGILCKTQSTPSELGKLRDDLKVLTRGLHSSQRPERANK